MEQHISSPTHSKRLYLPFTQSRHVLLETVLSSETTQNYSPAKSPAQIPTGKCKKKKKIRQLKSRIKTDCGGGDEVKIRHLSMTVSPLVPVPQGRFFKWLFHKSGVASEMQLVSFLTILICHGPGSNPRPQVPPSGHFRLSYRGVYNNQVYMIHFFQLLINLQQTFRISGDVLNIATFVFNFI